MVRGCVVGGVVVRLVSGRLWGSRCPVSDDVVVCLAPISGTGQTMEPTSYISA